MIGAAALRKAPAGVFGLWQTSVGKKAVMAVTGIILYGYVVLHMWGNLKLFVGATFLDEYALWLREVGQPLFPREGLLWTVRVILLVSVVLHIVAAYQLTRMNWAGRPVGYRTRKDVQATYASRTMRWSGVIILLFVIFHLLDLTTGTANPNFVYGRVYDNVVASFSRPYVSLVYTLAVGALGLHLYHGVWSAFQTLGLNNTRWNGFWRGLAILSGLALFLGNASMPLAVLAGVVK